MRSNPGSPLKADSLMGYFVKIGNEKGIDVHVTVDGDPMPFLRAVGIITKLGTTGPGNMEMKRMILPEFKAVGYRKRGKVLA